MLLDIVRSGKIKFDKSRNDFPGHAARSVQPGAADGRSSSPSGEILEEIVPAHRFREMTPHGVNNYCCGGGSGFAIMSGHNFSDWRHHLLGRRKLQQILNAFKDEPMDQEHPKYVCAPVQQLQGPDAGTSSPTTTPGKSPESTTAAWSS